MVHSRSCLWIGTVRRGLDCVAGACRSHHLRRAGEDGATPAVLSARGQTIAPVRCRRSATVFVLSVVMAGLVPAIHVFANRKKKGVDARDKAGHDDKVTGGSGRLLRTPSEARTASACG